MKLLSTLSLGLLLALSVRAEENLSDLRVKADAGNPSAQNDLGSLYQRGEQVPLDLKKAVGLYRQAAESGLAAAQYNLGFMYDTGQGTYQDQWVATDWYKKSAAQGYVPAMLNLGINYAGGEGVEQDVVEGMKWIDLARMLAAKETDSHLKWRINGAFEALKEKMKSSQFRKAEAESQAVFDEFYSKKKN